MVIIKTPEEVLAEKGIGSFSQERAEEYIAQIMTRLEKEYVLGRVIRFYFREKLSDRMKGYLRTRFNAHGWGIYFADTDETTPTTGIETFATISKRPTPS